MSLFSIIDRAAQSLLNTQTQIGVVSDNISNSQNSGYVARNTSLVDSAGGDQVVDVSRQVNQALQQSLLGQTTATTGTSYLNSIYQQLEQLSGSASGTPTLTSAMQALVTAFQNYAAEPGSQTTQTAVIQAASGLASAVQTLSNGIETIASQVQSQAESDVTTLNTQLSTIASLNQQIVTAQAAGRSTADLEDQRDAAVAQVAQLMPVSTTAQADGSLTLSTPGGVQLVSGSNAAQFNYTPYSLGTNGTAGTDAALTLQGDTSKTNYNAIFSSGKIGTELNILRVDDAGAASTDPSVAPLEKVRRQLDALVDQFYSSNAATPTAFQAAYNNATTDAGTTELASNLFIVNNQGPGGSPQPAGSDRTGFEVNPALLNGTATLKPAAANAVLQALTGNVSTTALSAGDVTNFTGTFTQLAEAIATAQTGRASTVSASATTATAALSTTQTAYSNATGVSVDQQLSSLVTLQSSYNASAKVISIVNSLNSTLMGIFGTG